MAVEKGKGIKASSSQKAWYCRRESKPYLVLPPFPYGTKKIVTFFEQLVRITLFVYLRWKFSFPFQIKKTRGTALIIEEGPDTQPVSNFQKKFREE